jgi:hypothetical protein
LRRSVAAETGRFRLRADEFCGRNHCGVPFRVVMKITGGKIILASFGDVTRMATIFSKKCAGEVLSIVVKVDAGVCAGRDGGYLVGGCARAYPCVMRRTCKSEVGDRVRYGSLVAALLEHN